MKTNIHSEAAAHCAVQEWEAAAQRLARGDPSALVSMVPPPLRERFDLLLAPLASVTRPASEKVQHLADAVLEHERLISEGMSHNDAFKRVCGTYELVESVLDNALRKTRSDVNKELRRRRAATIS